MPERNSRARSFAHARTRSRLSPARRIAGYAAVLLAGASLAAMILPERTATAERTALAWEPPAPDAAKPAESALPPTPDVVQLAQAGAHAGPRGTSFNQKEAADLANQANDAVLRCDRAAARRHLTGMARLRRSLLDAARTGLVQGAREDAIALREAEDAIRLALAKDCPQNPQPVRALDAGMVFGFDDPPLAADVAKLVEEAEAAAKACDRDAYYDAIAKLRSQVAREEERARRFRTDFPDYVPRLLADVARMRLLIDYLVRTGDARFANCAPPRTAQPRPGTAAPPRTSAPPPATVTPPAGPQRPVGLPQTPGFVVEPWVAITVRFNDAEGAYSSDGGQAPGAGKGDKTQSNVCGGAEFRMPLFAFAEVAEMTGVTSFMLGTTEAGLRFGACELGSGAKVVFSEIRHGADGAVTLTERERTEIMLLFMLQQYFYIDVAGMFGSRQEASRGGQYAAADLAQAPGLRARNWWPFAVYFGVGPSFVRTTIGMTSNQVPGGGVFESASQRRWDTGVSFVVGGKTALCRDCALGNPVMFGIEGQWTRLPARNIAVTSSAFGFTESGRVSGRTASRVTFKVSVPFGLGR
jgi:hypothetical protein